MSKYLYLRMNRSLRAIKYRGVGSGMLISIAVAMYIALGAMIPSASVTLENKVESLTLCDYLVHVAGSDESKIIELSEIDGISEVDSRFSLSSRVSYINKMGENDSIPAALVGIDPQTGPKINKLDIRAGNFFSGNGSGTAILEKGFADRGGIEVGESISLLTDQGYIDLIIVGLTYSIEFGILPTNPQSIMPFPGTLAAVYLPIDWLRNAFSVPSNYVNDFLFIYDENANNVTVMSNVNDALTSNVILYTMERDEIPGYGLIKVDLEEGGDFVGVIAGLILMVAFFVIYSSFSRIVQEQRREIGVLRALGYTRGGVFLSYLYMAGVIGTIASLVGILIGYPFAYWYIDFYAVEAIQTPASAYIIPFDLIIGGLIFGPMTAALASGIATWSLVSMDPQEAIRGSMWRSKKPHKKMGSSRRRRSYITLYTIRSMMRQRIRTALMVLAISFAIVMGSMSFLLVASFNNSIQYSVEHGEHWDIIVDYAYPINETVAAGISSAYISEKFQISKLIGEVTDPVGGDTVIIIGMNSSQTLHDFTIKSGELAQGPDDVMINLEWADDNSIDIGDNVIVETIIRTKTLFVTAIVEEFIGNLFVDIDAIEDLAGETIVNGMYVKCEPGHIEDVKKNLASFPLVANAQLRTNLESGMTDLLADYQDILYVFSLVSVSISSIAISNIVYVSILERQGEYGQLRALGYSRRDVSKSIVTEIFILVMIGSIVALPLLFGVMEGFAGIMKSFWPVYTTIIYLQDWGGFVLIVVLALVLGLLAAVPAIRYLGKMDIAKIVSGGRFG